MVHSDLFRMRQEARSALFECIGIFHNRQRRKSSVGYRPSTSNHAHCTEERAWFEHAPAPGSGAMAPSASQPEPHLVNCR